MKVGFLGGGNMGGALMQGILKAKLPLFEQVLAYDPAPASRARLEDMGVHTLDSAAYIHGGSGVLLGNGKHNALFAVIAADGICFCLIEIKEGADILQLYRLARGGLDREVPEAGADLHIAVDP